MVAREVVRTLTGLGAVLVRTKGSHARYAFGACSTTVAMHKGDFAPKTLHAMQRDMEPVFGKGWLV